MESKIYVAGMDSDECEEKVNTVVSSVDGVTSCKASAMKANVVVEYDGTIQDIENKIKSAISSCGFEVL